MADTSTSQPKTYYKYEPSLAAACIFAAIFGVLTAFHTYKLIRTRTWFFLAFLTGGYFEVIGFICRAINASKTPYTWSFGLVVVETLGILLAPVLFAASVYMSLGRLLVHIDAERVSLVRRRWMTPFFVAGDVLSFLIQACGGAMIIQDDVDVVKRGKKIVLVGLWLQIVWFGFFIVNLLLCWWRLVRHFRRYSYSSHHRQQSIGQTFTGGSGPKDGATDVAGNGENGGVPEGRRPRWNTGWRIHMLTIFTVSALIMVRCIYRVIEYTQGPTGYLMTHEVFLYVLDAMLMVICMIIFGLVHPSGLRKMVRDEHTELRSVESGAVPLSEAERSGEI